MLSLDFFNEKKSEILWAIGVPHPIYSMPAKNWAV